MKGVNMYIKKINGDLIGEGGTIREIAESSSANLSSANLSSANISRNLGFTLLNSFLYFPFFSVIYSPG